MRLSLLVLSLLIIQISRATCSQAQGMGDLSISPTRVVFEGSKKSELLTITNRGSKPAAYSVQFVQYEMNLDGQLHETTDPAPGMLLADQVVTFSPTRLTLRPGESQTVTLKVAANHDTKKGEYRSHLYFKAIPPDSSTGLVANKDSAKEDFSVHLSAVFGLSIPVIVRVGHLSARAAIVGPQLSSDAKAVSFELRRSGDESLYGDFSVLFTPKLTARSGAPKSRKPILLNSTRGVALYTPNRIRNVTLSLQPPDAAALGPGKVSITYRDHHSAAILAKREITLP